MLKFSLNSSLKDAAKDYVQTSVTCSDHVELEVFEPFIQNHNNLSICFSGFVGLTRCFLNSIYFNRINHSTNSVHDCSLNQNQMQISLLDTFYQTFYFEILGRRFDHTVLHIIYRHTIHGTCAVLRWLWCSDNDAVLE